MPSDMPILLTSTSACAWAVAGSARPPLSANSAAVASARAERTSPRRAPARRARPAGRAAADAVDGEGMAAPRGRRAIRRRWRVVVATAPEAPSWPRLGSARLGSARLGSAHNSQFKSRAGCQVFCRAVHRVFALRTVVTGTRAPDRATLPGCQVFLRVIHKLFSLGAVPTGSPRGGSSSTPGPRGRAGGGAVGLVGPCVDARPVVGRASGSLVTAHEPTVDATDRARSSRPPYGGV